MPGYEWYDVINPWDYMRVDVIFSCSLSKDVSMFVGNMKEGTSWRYKLINLIVNIASSIE